MFTWFDRDSDTKGLFTPNDSVTVTVTLTGGTFDLFNRQCDGKNGLHSDFAHQRNVFDGVVRCEQTLIPIQPISCDEQIAVTIAPCEQPLIAP